MIFEEAAGGREEEPRGPARRLKKSDFPQDCRGLLPSPGEADIRPGCSQGRDAENAAMLQGKLFTAIDKFLTTSPLVNKIKLLIVSISFFYSSFLSFLLPLSPLLHWRTFFSTLLRKVETIVVSDLIVFRAVCKISSSTLELNGNDILHIGPP